MAIRIDRPEPKGTSGGINLTTDLKDTRINATGALNTLLGLVDRRREEEERQTLEDIFAQRLGESVGLKDIPQSILSAKEFRARTDAQKPIAERSNIQDRSILEAERETLLKEAGGDSNILEDLVPIPRKSVGDSSTVHSSPYDASYAGKLGESQEEYPFPKEVPVAALEKTLSDLDRGSVVGPPPRTAGEQFQEKYGRIGLPFLTAYAEHEQLKERQDLERIGQEQIAQRAATELEKTEIAKFKRDDLAKRTAVLQQQGFDQRTAKVLLEGQESQAAAKALSARNLEILKNELNPPKQNFENFITAALNVINSNASPALKEKARGDIEFLKKHKIAIALAGKPITNMKMIPAGALDKLIGFQDLQNDLTRAMEYFHPNYTGPLDRRFGDFREWTGRISDEEIKFRQTVKFIEEIFSRKQTGAVISPEERPGFKALVPTLDDKPNVFLIKRSHFFDLMQDRVNTRVSTYSQFLFGNVPEDEVTNALNQKRNEKADGVDVSQVSTEQLLKRNNIRLPIKKN